MFLTLLLASSPLVSLGVPDAHGCASEVRLDGVKLSGGPAPLCIREAVSLVLENTPVVVLRVEAPHRFESRIRSRVFVYRIAGGRLVPRFLGSGFSSREVTHLLALDGALGLETQLESGEHQTLRCVFDGFPLVCSESTP